MGYRVFEIEEGGEERRRLREFHKRLCLNDPALPKNAKLYHKSWEIVKVQARENRLRAGKRTPPKRDPAFYLKAKFVKDGKLVHGSWSAPVVIDLGRGELRIPCAGIRIPLAPSLLKALEEELKLTPKPEFIVQLRHNGKLRIIACRRPPAWWVAVREESSDFRDVHFPRPFVAVGVDINSRHGITVLAFEVDNKKVRRVLRRRIKFYKKEWRLIKLLQSFAALSTNVHKGRQSAYKRLREAYERLREEFPELPPTPGKARRVIKVYHRAHAARVRAKEHKLSELIRALARSCGGRVVVLVDKPSPESLKGRPWQNTILRVAKRLRVTVRYEGGYFREVRASGKRCPLCREEGSPREEKRRKRPSYFSCHNCGIAWNRDYGASFAAILEGLPWLAEELRGWLRDHPGDLLGSAPP